MAREKDLWANLRSVIRPSGGDIIRVENGLGEGTPDVNYCINGVEGWIELKSVESWPKRNKTPLRVNHFTQEQKVWIRRRWNAGGRVFVLLQIWEPREYIMLNGSTAVSMLGNESKVILRMNSEWWRMNILPYNDLLNTLLLSRNRLS